MALSTVMKGFVNSPLTRCLAQNLPLRTPFTFAKIPLLNVLTKLNFTTTNALENVRCHFPRPSEVKRIRKHGWKKRMSTMSGRRVLMNRILKGRWVLSH